MADVAFAAGFASVRQFNDSVRPSSPKARASCGGGPRPGGRVRRHRRPPRPCANQTVVLRLPFRAPLCPDNLFGHLAATAVPGVEEIRDGAYRRTLRLPHGPGLVPSSLLADHIRAAITLVDLRDLGDRHRPMPTAP